MLLERSGTTGKVGPQRRLHRPCAERVNGGKAKHLESNRTSAIDSEKFVHCKTGTYQLPYSVLVSWYLPTLAHHELKLVIVVSTHRFADGYIDGLDGTVQYVSNEMTYSTKVSKRQEKNVSLALKGLHKSTDKMGKKEIAVSKESILRPQRPLDDCLQTR